MLVKVLCSCVLYFVYPKDAAAIERLNETGELKNLVKEFKVRENSFFV
jgi:hypothetical protein